MSNHKENLQAPASESAEDISKDSESKKEKWNISAKEAYFISLNEWVKHANISQNAMALFPWYLMTTYPQIFQQQAALSATGLWGVTPHLASINQQSLHIANRGPLRGRIANQAATAADFMNRADGVFRILNEQSQAELINLTGGYEYIVAPFWKRAVAESIDAVILFIIKAAILFVAMNIFGLEFYFMFDIDKEVFGRMVQREEYYSIVSFFDILGLLGLSSNILLLEMVVKIFVCFYETGWTVWSDGSTPGKMVMGLSIKYVEAMRVWQQQPPQNPLQLGFQQAGMQLHALLYPAETPTFLRAFARALAKNLIMGLLFPMCFIVVFFKNNRTAYDLMTKTVVVENPMLPPLLRRDVR